MVKNDEEKVIQTPEKSDWVNQLLVNFQDFNSKIRSKSNSEELYLYLLDQCPKLLSIYVKDGEEAFRTLEANAIVTDPEIYLLHFSYPDRIKTLGLLCRDAMLQLCIAKLRKSEELISQEAFNTHFAESRELLATEFEQSFSYFQQEREKMLSNTEVLQRKLESIKHLVNPWSLYQGQFLTLIEQFKEIDLSDNKLNQTIINYFQIKDLVIQMRGDVLALNEFFAKKAKKSLEELKNLEEKEDLDHVIRGFGELVNLAIGQDIRSETSMRSLEDLVNKLPLLTIPIAAKEGYLIHRKIDIRKSVQKWLDYEILPYLVDLWDNEEATFSHLINVASQIKNSLLVAQKTQSLPGFHGEIASLSTIVSEQEDTITKSKEMVSHIDHQLATKFKVTEIYKEEEYLKVPLQTNFARFTGSDPGSFAKLTHLAKQIFENLGRQVKEVKEKSPHQKLETALEILETRNGKETPDHYHSLFLNKNFIGDLFLVKRTNFESELEKIVNYWNRGQNRSLAVVGDPLSGKSTLLEFGTHLFQSNEVHFLKPDSDLTIEGRKYKTSKNLGEAFTFIKRSISNSKPILVIDDLHLWRDSTNSLISNALALVDFITSNASKAFVIIGISNSLRIHLDTRIPFSLGFTNLMDINTASIEEIYKAVMLRHGASHRPIFEKEGVPMKEVDLRKKISWLSKKYDYNIGAVLQAWIFCTDIEPDASIRFTEKETHLNDFLSTSELLILKNCLLFGHSTDLELKNLFTDRFELEFKPAIRKMLNIGILDREAGGALIVKNTVRQDIYSILKYRELLA
jgi:hypothetical protein